MDSLTKKIDKVEQLVLDEGYGYKEAVDRVKYDIDGEQLYDVETGQTVCQDITTATDEQVRGLLQIKKELL
ncbi:hypothetical protein ACJDU8_17395 [Clostridium sp. WILCCON 0269]|uniref:Uncharacterized protein n=1 Tax=Candidatus Clostridium eludens TaxID=3381663 RepID=A0ABW8SMQ4_9CLOT